MPLHRRACALGLTLSLVSSATAAAAALTSPDAVRYVEGRATTQGGDFIYTEAHWIYGDGAQQSRLVLYRCPDGKPFARKAIHADGNAQAPDFELDDAQSGYREGVRTDGGKRVVFVRTSKNAAERTATLDTSPMPVIDAGFDAYIRSHWDALNKGSDSIPFLVPSRLGTLRFTVKSEGGTRIEGHDARKFQLGLDSLIGFALPHLDVAYDTKTHELLSFSGIANIRSSTGRNVSAKILFDPSRNRDVSRADLDAAMKAPLDGHCNIP